PGFLSKEYISGHRASYLHPIRMYVFVSAVFFIVFFSYFNVNEMGMDDSDKPGVASSAKKATDTPKEKALANAKTAEDSMLVERIFKGQAPIDSLDRKDSASKSRKRKGWNYSINHPQFSTKEEYDSAQKALPSSQRDGWLSRQLQLRNIE